MLPDVSIAPPDTSKDCFARDKFADYRDDMGGVGSFARQNRTLYVGRIKETGTGVETEEVVKRHFREWGEIEKSACHIHSQSPNPNCITDLSSSGFSVRILQYRSVAFVTYVSEGNAQFAKESMACQSLDNDEILNVRWATEDPNPESKVAEKRRLEEMGQEAIQARMDPRIVDAMRAMRALEEGDASEDDGIVVEELDDGQPDAKKRRLALEDGSDESEEPEPFVEPEPPQPKGLLSADTLESLKYFTEIRKRSGQGVGSVSPSVKPPLPPTGLGLTDYGSDEED